MFQSLVVGKPLITTSAAYRTASPCSRAVVSEKSTCNSAVRGSVQSGWCFVPPPQFAPSYRLRRTCVASLQSVCRSRLPQLFHTSVAHGFSGCHLFARRLCVCVFRFQFTVVTRSSTRAPHKNRFDRGESNRRQASHRRASHTIDNSRIASRVRHNTKPYGTTSHQHPIRFRVYAEQRLRSVPVYRSCCGERTAPEHSVIRDHRELATKPKAVL